MNFYYFNHFFNIFHNLIVGKPEQPDIIYVKFRFLVYIPFFYLLSPVYSPIYLYCKSIFMTIKINNKKAYRMLSVESCII